MAFRCEQSSFYDQPIGDSDGNSEQPQLFTPRPERTLRERLGFESPPYSECAYIAKRPLSWAAWIPGVSRNPILEPANKELSHEHLIFGQSSDNIGFGPSGLFAEDTGAQEYRREETCYDGATMREAIADTEEPSYYGFVLSNCQSYIERIRERYEALKARIVG